MAKINNFPKVLSIQWLKDAYLKEIFTPEEVIKEILNRVEADDNMNIWITKPNLLFITPYLDKLKDMDINTLPLYGIPFAVKDNMDVALIPTTAGCPQYKYIPSENAVVVQRLIEAGAIPIGKTNMDQFATGLVGTRSPYGETHNALDEELISGGSSSGSAVAVARGQVAFALGTDTAGSGRVPAALNGIFGYKPSIGAWPIKGLVPACASLDCITVFTNNIEDTYKIDSVVRGYDAEDPWSKDIPHPVLSAPKKICLPKNKLIFFGIHAKVYEKAWRVAVEKIEKLNIPIEYINYDLFQEAASILYDGPWVAERWAELGNFVSDHPNATFPVIEEILRSGEGDKHSATDVFNAIHKLQKLKLQARNILQESVLIMPTAGGTWTREQVRQEPISTNSAMGKYTNHCNLLDLSAVAMPSGEATYNIPFGITVFALSDNEGFLYETAKLYRKPRKNTTLVGVCGLHMRGFLLEAQMHQFAARFIREDFTAPKYKLIKLNTNPQKPGLIKNIESGASIQLEIWEMPTEEFGEFVTTIAAPLGMGRIELQDGSEVQGFLCEGYVDVDLEDISDKRSWRNLY